MARLRDDTLHLTQRGGSAKRRRPVRLMLPGLIFLSLGLLLLSRLNHTQLNDMRWRVAAAMSPVLQAAMVPLVPVRDLGRKIAAQVDLSAEVERLHTENQKLANWEWRARELEQKLADLEALSKVVAEQQLGFVTSRVIGDSSGAFVRSVMIDAGGAQNVKTGYPVINADGLVGRIVETGAVSSRVLLATDINSRIPVTVGRNNVRAILVGDTGPSPRLMFVPQDAQISVGDDVATSGAGGLFPRGLRIGVVEGDGADRRVAMRAKLNDLQYVSVLFFDDPAAGLSGAVAPTQKAPYRPAGAAASGMEGLKR